MKASQLNIHANSIATTNLKNKLIVKKPIETKPIVKQ